MKKSVMILLGTFALSTSAFAAVYDCGPLENSGHPLLGGPSYAVETLGQRVILEVTTGAIAGPRRTDEYTMVAKTHEPDGSTYEAFGITAAIFATPVNGRVLTSVSVSEDIRGESYSAQCNEREELSGLVDADLLKAAPMVTQWHSSDASLTIQGGGATIQFSCGSISIENWNEQGMPMQGLDHSGLMMVHPTSWPVTVTAQLRNGSLYVRVGTGSGSQYIFVPGEPGPHAICL